MTDVTILYRARGWTSCRVLGSRRRAARHVLHVLAASWALHGFAAAAAADDGEPEEGFTVGLGHSVSREDNLFRLPDDVRPPEGGSRSDRISRTTAALGFEHTYSLQRVIAGVEMTHRNYDRHNQLDRTTASGALRWDWAAGRQWTGTATLLQRQAPRSFADTDRRIRSINTLRRIGADADYWWHPDWSFLVGAEHTRSRYSDERSDASEYDESAIEAGIGYRPKSGNRLSLVARQADGDYPNRTPSARVDSGYEQRDLRLRGSWVLSGISSFSGYVGYTRREYEHVSSLDFSGPTGRIAFGWEPTGKLSFQVIARREIGSEYEVIDNYVVTRGVGVEGTWKATDKITVIARGERYRRDRSDVELPALDDDRTRVYGLSVGYAPLRDLTITASVQRAKRSAAGERFDYTAKIHGIDVRLDF
ncbi:XrtB/PEP-CTERM-associated polysaccharide biosynthesis outer membrane protein EpsL [Aromatoleum anaerobium]|uniref:Outer membrane beta-barrel protein n=1 Tax=Aromatoleum anaerobium TaxID=182180 RepID=A0ABX1PGY2_9RHOO|nr:XrtB/PEP-CTERM-associated polysaccharide biosynthesis outer membrane protein EpsL [Aromatoleum anaerobium]MCK0507738.1 outer membrane beta-barrel protein [Aromatoleum anaerobium]